MNKEVEKEIEIGKAILMDKEVEDGLAYYHFVRAICLALEDKDDKN